MWTCIKYILYMMEANELWGGGKFILGPMVRASSLPLRLAALDYGADVVYSEEIPAHRASLSLCKRFDNPVLRTVDFIEKKKDGNNTLVLFRTDKQREVECKKCVLQLGCNDSVTALKAAQLFENDVAAIDINMGCSKHYSTSRGMGSALMKKPEIVEDIIKTLRRNLSIPVSVKTRLYDTEDCCHTSNNSNQSIVDLKRSIEWLDQLQACGVQCVTMHMRTPSEKYRDKTHINMFSILHRHMRNTNIPLVFNGDIWTARNVEAVRNSVRADYSYYSESNNTITDSSTSSSTNTVQCCCYSSTSTDWEENLPTQSRKACLCNRKQSADVSFMLSRAGLWNPAVFQQLRPKCVETRYVPIPSTTATPPAGNSMSDVMACIIKHSISTANCPLNTRYLLQHILAGSKQLHTPIRETITRYYDLKGVAESMGFGEYAINQYKQQEKAWSAVFERPYFTSSVHKSSGGSSNSTFSTCSTTTATSSSTTAAIEKYLNSASWPGIISQTSHEYNDRYFDDNYYIAFNKPPSATGSTNITSTANSSNSSSTSSSHSSSQGTTKRPFSYAGFSESNSSVVRVKMKM